MSMSLLTGPALSVFMAVKLLEKPWSKHGGARLSEIANQTKHGALAVSLILQKLVQEGLIIGLNDEATPKKKMKITRYYLNIYPLEKGK